jgi:ABC-type spermidine/putrescine transport system permease subunit II
MSIVLFRRLLILYVLLSVASGVAGILGTGYYSTELYAAYEAEPTWLNTHFWTAAIGIIALLVAGVAGMVGLYQLKGWGRTVSLCTSIAGLALFTIVGPILTWPLESALSEAGTCLWGALLGAAYFSPLRQQFSGESAASNAIYSKAAPVHGES